MDSENIIKRLGGPAEVAALCECTSQAVSQWYGKDDKGNERTIPNARLLYLKAIRPEVFAEDANA